MKFFRPFSTLAMGVALGVFGPKMLRKVGVNLPIG